MGTTGLKRIAMRNLGSGFDEVRLGRRQFFGLAAGAVAGLAAPRSVGAEPEAAPASITGAANPNLEPFDKLMTSFVAENKVPGAALAVTRHGKLVYARGFGFADVEKKEQVQPDALFRIASISKPITAVAIMQLVEKGKLGLDDNVMDRMKLVPLVGADAKFDERWKKITIRQCLQHTGGWDRGKSGDPIEKPWQIAKAFQIETPVAPSYIVRYMMGQPLDFDPGTRYVYSNLGYLILGRIIEESTGQKYEHYVKKEVLQPLGIKSAQLGRALPENRVKGEVVYYDPKKYMSRCLYPPRVGERVPIQYGGLNFEAFEAHGAWIASAVELVKFAAAFDNPARSLLLSAKSIEQMWARPEGAPGFTGKGAPRASYYACGWNVRPMGNAGKSNQYHAGYIAGSESFLVRRLDGLNWAVLFNTAHNPDGKLLTSLIDGPIHEAADQVKQWPDIDQFSQLLN
jgi:CubicO group peptidase (beta-lactamase class C family)